jgi:hypothetical protein
VIAKTSAKILSMRGIEFEVIWFDQDVIECRVRCSNGPFCGTADIYLAHDDLLNAADMLSGFPSHIGDLRSLDLGNFNVNMAGGSIHMAFSCVDSVGHAVVTVKLRADGCGSVGTPESASFYVPVEAGSIDAFVQQARSVRDTIGAKAYLHMADHTVDWVRRKFSAFDRNRAD